MPLGGGAADEERAAEYAAVAYQRGAKEGKRRIEPQGEDARLYPPRQAKAQEVVAVAGVEPVAARRPAVLGDAVPGAAVDDPVGAQLGTTWIVLRLFRVRSIPILASLPTKN